MLINEFGDKNNPAVLCMHGMMQRWESEYKLLKPLEEHYRLIIPAMDGFYDGCEDFTSFDDQADRSRNMCRHIIMASFMVHTVHPRAV